MTSVWEVFVLSHPSAKCAEGWGTLFLALAKKKQILRFTQDDIRDESNRDSFRFDS
jgi:hypothetical protein